MSGSRWIAAGAINAALAVGAGAFAAHGLKDTIPAERLEVFRTGADYHLYHALALLILGVLFRQRPSLWLVAAGWIFLAGIVLFSGSLYLFAVTGERSWGMVAPVGGVAFLLGWACTGIGGVRASKTPRDV